MIKLEKKARQLTGEERERVTQFFGDEQFPQNRHWVLGTSDLTYARERNNIDRPGGYGFLIHDLLTTCAILHAGIETAENEVEAIRYRMDLIRETARKVLDYDTSMQPMSGYEAWTSRLRSLVEGTDHPSDSVNWRERALTAEKERDEARSLKVPPAAGELLRAQMEAAVLRTELEALKQKVNVVVETFRHDGHECIDRLMEKP